MNELLEKLHEKIVVLADNYRGGNADDAFIHEATNDIIYAASEVYRHPEIKLHMPVSDTGSMMVYQEEGDMNFIPLMLSVDEEQADMRAIVALASCSASCAFCPKEYRLEGLP